MRKKHIIFIKCLKAFLFLMFVTSCSNYSNEPTNNGDSKGKIPETNPTSESIFQLTTTWQTEEGDTLLLTELKGKVLVMVMIYTTCKAACPRLVADMKGIREQIPDKYTEEVQYILVSIDPEHDTPARLKSFAKIKEMDGNEWTFLQGNTESVREFANVLSVKYKEISPLDFSHSNIISVFNKKGELIHQLEGLGVNNRETVELIIKTANES